MIYVNSFLLCGLICLLGQLIFSNTKLTSGHITSLFVVIGVVLAFFGLYDAIKEFGGAGASLPIISFGHLLFDAAYEGIRENGISGLFSNILVTTSAGISSAVLFSFLVAVFFKAKS